MDNGGKFFCFFIFLLAAVPKTFSQTNPTITVVDVDPGPYGQGSTIAARIKINGYFKPDNKFQLILSDPSGNFTAVSPVIGEYNSFFTTFVVSNKLNNVAAGTGYKLKVVSTSPVVEGVAANPITIVNQAGPTVDIKANYTLEAGNVFGFCDNPANAERDIEFTNNSTSGAVVSAQLDNDLSTEASKTFVFDASNKQTSKFSVAYFTGTFKAVSNGVVSTRCYTILNTSFKKGLSDGVNNNSCDLDYTAAITADPNNYPRLIYKIKWGDDNESEFTHQQVMDQSGKLKHKYEKSSCDKDHNVNGTWVYNAYQVSLEVKGAYCNVEPNSIFARISKLPTAAFEGTSKACVNSEVSFSNTSLSGTDVQGGIDCNAESAFIWEIDNKGNEIYTKVSEETNLKYKFTEPGTYHIRLGARNANSPDCKHSMVQTICISEMPNPQIQISQSSLCLSSPVDVTASSTTVETNICESSYKWVLLDNASSPVPTAKYSVLSGTINSKGAFKNISLRIKEAGKYKLRLYVYNACSEPDGVYRDKEFSISGPISVKMPDAQTWCISNSTIDFGSEDNKPTYTGTSTTPKYTWEVSGGNFEFVDGTTAADEYPKIKFLEAKTYTITVRYENDCGQPKSASQQITFDPLPVGGTATSVTEPICGGTNEVEIKLTGHLGELKYWQMKPEGESTWQDINTSINPYTYTNLGKTTEFRAVVTNGKCTSEAFSQPAKVVIKETPAAPTVTTEINYCHGDIPSQLTAQGDGVSTLRWYKESLSNPWTLIAPTPATNIDNPKGGDGYKYYVTQVSPNSTCESLPAEIVVYVNPIISENEIGNSQTICYNTEPAELLNKKLTGGIADKTYEWQYKVEGTNTWNSISGATEETYKPGKLTTNTFFKRIVRSGGCVKESNEIKITIIPAIENYDISNREQIICYNTSPALLNGQASTMQGNAQGLSYQWMSNSDGSWNNINGATDEDYQPGALEKTTYFRRVTSKTVNGIACSVESQQATVTVYPKPKIDVKKYYYCNGSEAEITFTSSTTNEPLGSTSYTYTIDNRAILTNDAYNSNTQKLSFKAINTADDLPAVAKITVTGKYLYNSIECQGEAAEIIVTVLPTIKAKAIADFEVCEGAVAYVGGFRPETTGDAHKDSVTYTWEVSGQDVGLQNGSGPQLPSFTAKSTNGVDLVAYVKVTPSFKYVAGPCTGMPDTYTITVKPKPSVSDAGRDVIICGTDSYTLNGNNPTVGEGKWVQIKGPAVIFDNVSSRTAKVSDLKKNNRYEFQWVISNGECEPNTDNVIVDVLSDISVSLSANSLVICPGSPVTLTPNIAGGDVGGSLDSKYTYLWEFSYDGANWLGVGASSDPEPLTVGPLEATYYRLKVKSHNMCEVTSLPIWIDSRPAIPEPKPGNDEELCDVTSLALNANDPGANFTGTWSVEDSPNALIFSPNANDPKAVVSGLVPGNSYTLVWTISDTHSCPAKSAKKVIRTLKPLTNNGIILSVSQREVCTNGELFIEGTKPNGGTGGYQYTWQVSVDQVSWSVLPGQKDQDFNGPIPGSGEVYVRRYVTSGACSSASTAIPIKILPSITNNIISKSQTICEGTKPEKFTGTIPAGGTGQYDYRWEIFNEPSNEWLTIGYGPDFQSDVLTKTTKFRRIVESGQCNGASGSRSDPITITVDFKAKPDFKASKYISCAPFDLKQVITVTPYSDRNTTYEWYTVDNNGNNLVKLVDNDGDDTNFPGYTITNDGQEVNIKLVVGSKHGCGYESQIHTFKTVSDFTPLYSKTINQPCGPLEVTFQNKSTMINGGSVDDLIFTWYDRNNKVISNDKELGAKTLQPAASHMDTTYVFKLTASNGCIERTFVDSVLVRATPLAMFSLDRTSGCSPFKLEISNTSRGVDAKYGPKNKFIWDFGDGSGIFTTYDLKPITHDYTTGVTKKYKVKLTVENECGSDSKEYEIIVYPTTIQAGLTLVGLSKYGCAPFPVTFDNNTTGATRFKWDFGDGNIEYSSLSPERKTHLFEKAGKYTVTLNASNDCSSATATQEIEVFERPLAKFSINRPKYCLGDPVSFVNYNTSTEVTYTWKFGDGLDSHEREPKHVYTAAGTYEVQLIVEQVFPNGSSCSTEAIKQKVEILPLPVPSFTNNEMPINCVPFKLEVQSTSSSATSVAWDFGDPTSLTNNTAGTNSSHVYTKPGDYTIEAKFYNASGCVESLRKTITITDSPVANFTSSVESVCGTKATISFTNTSTYSGQDQVNYTWIIDNGAVFNQKNIAPQTIQVPANATMPYKAKIELKATSTIGCPSSIVKYIQFNPLPEADFSIVSKADKCVPYLLGLNQKSKYADFYEWFVNGQLVSKEPQPTNIVLKEPNKVYTIELKVSNIYGCIIASKTLTETTFPKPDAKFTVTSNKDCTGLLLLDVHNATIGATKYTWNFGDSRPDSHEKEPKDVRYTPGRYILRLIAENQYACADTAYDTVYVAKPVMPGFVANKTSGCDSIHVTFKNLTENATEYIWDFGDNKYSSEFQPTWPFQARDSAYTVKLIAKGEFGCQEVFVYEDYITVTPLPVPKFDILPEEKIYAPNFTFTFKNKTVGESLKYKWLFGDGKSYEGEEPSPHTYEKAGTYDVKLIAINDALCRDTIVKTVNIEIIPGYLYVPNAFEPGNVSPELQEFKPKGFRLVKYSMKIFNRWGELIFQTDKLDGEGRPLEGWDGKMKGLPALQGVYVWDITAVFQDGTEWQGMSYDKSGKNKRKSGPVHLIR